jgi:hypothetical protein
MRSAVKQSEIEVTNALTELGLTKDILRDAVLIGEIARDSCTANDPKSAPGIFAWARTVRGLRESLLPKNWHKNDDMNFPTVISPDRSFAIAVMTGDEGTGRIEAIPTTKYRKGIATKLAVKSNELSLFSFLPDYVEEKQVDLRLTWILLRRRDEDSVFSELSLPASISKDGQVESWNTRIILDPIEVDPMPTIQDDDGSSEPPVVVTVRRRS